MFHGHKWETISSYFNPPVTRVSHMKGATTEDMMNVLYGFTVVTQRCGECGEQRAYTVVGRTE